MNQRPVNQRPVNHLETVEALMREAAETLILPRWKSLAEGDVEEKDGPQDLVTIADQEAEAFLTPHLQDLIPGSIVIGEEAVSAGTVSPEFLKDGGDCWLVDPVDGTWNFVQGSERFGVMVARVQRREVVQSWILYPVDGRCLVAEKGAGATFGGERLGPHAAKPFPAAHGDYSATYVKEPFRSAFDKVAERCAGHHSGRCSAYAYGDLARGLLDFTFYCKLSPWDHAPGQLIVEEAGGRFGFLKDSAPYTPIPRPDQPMLATASAEAWPMYAEEMAGVDSANGQP